MRSDPFGLSPAAPAPAPPPGAPPGAGVAAAPAPGPPEAAGALAIATQPPRSPANAKRRTFSMVTSLPEVSSSRRTFAWTGRRCRRSRWLSVRVGYTMKAAHFESSEKPSEAVGAPPSPGPPGPPPIEGASPTGNV